MTRPTARRLLSLALAAALSGPALAQNFEAFTVSDIRVDGLQRISAGTVFTYLPVEKGDVVDRNRSNEAIRSLFRTGFFSDVKLERQGQILVVTVVERPAINTITLEGNKELKTDELLKGLEGIGLSEGETYNPLNLDRVTQELTRQYNNRGKYSITIAPTITQLDRNRVDLKIAISEGKAAKIRDINIVGNALYTDEAIRDSWESSTSNWLSFYRKDDQYSREKLSGDLEKLSDYYLDRGYVDFNVESTQIAISPTKQDMFITANVTEGDKYTISDVKVSGDTIVPVEQIEKLLAVKKGATFSRVLLEASSNGIITVLSNLGYAFAEANPVPEIDRAAKTVAINFVVAPGSARAGAPRVVPGQRADRRRGPAPRDAPVRVDLVLAGRDRPFQDPPAAPGLLRDGGNRNAGRRRHQGPGRRRGHGQGTQRRQLRLRHRLLAGRRRGRQRAAEPEQLPRHRQPLRHRPVAQQLFQGHQFQLPGPVLHPGRRQRRLQPQLQRLRPVDHVDRALLRRQRRGRSHVRHPAVGEHQLQHRDRHLPQQDHHHRRRHAAVDLRLPGQHAGRARTLRQLHHRDRPGQRSADPDRAPVHPGRESPVDRQCLDPEGRLGDRHPQQLPVPELRHPAPRRRGNLAARAAT